MLTINLSFSFVESSPLFITENFGLLISLTLLTLFILWLLRSGRGSSKDPPVISPQRRSASPERQGFIASPEKLNSSEMYSREQDDAVPLQRNSSHGDHQVREFNIKIREQYASRRNLEPEEILEEMQSLGLHPDVTTVNTLLDVCLEQANYEKAFNFFEKLKTHHFAHLFSESEEPRDEDSLAHSFKPDIITYNTVIKGLTRQITDKRSPDANRKILNTIVDKLEEIEKLGLTPSDITYNSILDACVKADEISLAFKFFDKMRAVNLTPDNITYSTLVKGIKNHHGNKHRHHAPIEVPKESGAGPFRKGQGPKEEVYDLNKVFELLTMVKADNYIKPDEILFNCVIDACVKFRDMNKAMNVYDTMKELGEEPDSVTYSTLIKGFGNMRNFNKVMDMYNRMRTEKVKMSESSYVAMIDASLKCHKTDQAMDFFVAMRRDNSVRVGAHVFSMMIKGFTNERKFEKAYEIFAIMKSYYPTPPDLSIYHQMMESAIKCFKAQSLFDIYDDLLNPQPRRKSIGGDRVEQNNDKLKPTLVTQGIYIKGLCLFGNIQKAMQVYKAIREDPTFEPEEVVFSSLMHGLQKAGELNSALQIYEEMREFKVKPTNLTYSTLIKIHSELMDVETALEVFEESKRLYGPDLVLYNCMIQTCIRNKKMDQLREVYAEMRKDKVKGDEVFFNTIVSGFAFNHCTKEALDIIHETLSYGLLLNEEVYYNVLRAINRKISNRGYGTQEMTSEEYKRESDNLINVLLNKGVRLDLDRVKETKEFHGRRKSDDVMKMTEGLTRQRSSTGQMSRPAFNSRPPGFQKRNSIYENRTQN